MSLEEARNKVQSILNTIYSGSNIIINNDSIPFDVMIIDDDTIEKNDLFVFFYDSKEYLLNKNDSYALAGNAGIIFDKKTGEIFMANTTKPISYFINDYPKNKMDLVKLW